MKNLTPIHFLLNNLFFHYFQSFFYTLFSFCKTSCFSRETRNSLTKFRTKTVELRNSDVIFRSLTKNNSANILPPPALQPSFQNDTLLSASAAIFIFRRCFSKNKYTDAWGLPRNIDSIALFARATFSVSPMTLIVFP